MNFICEFKGCEKVATMHLDNRNGIVNHFCQIHGASYLERSELPDGELGDSNSDELEQLKLGKTPTVFDENNVKSLFEFENIEPKRLYLDEGFLLFVNLSNELSMAYVGERLNIEKLEKFVFLLNRKILLFEASQSQIESCLKKLGKW